jgi:hypothetical protein
MRTDGYSLLARALTLPWVCGVIGLSGGLAQQPDTLRHSISPPPVGLQAGANLGYSVAMDGGYAVVGAPYDDVGAPDSGVVRIFDSSSGALLYTLVNPSPAKDDNFGYSVAISGTRMVAGALGDDTAGYNAGAVYLYDLGGATPTVPVITFYKPDADLPNSFGWSVAISGMRMVVGTADNAYVYDLAGATPTTPVLTLHDPSSAAIKSFGNAVAISNLRVVVGAFLDDTGGSQAGSAYVYDLASATPTVPLVTLNNPTPMGSEKFGSAVAISGNWVIAGVPDDSPGVFSAGSAYVYDLASGTPVVPVATLTSPSPKMYDQFGFSVSISGARLVVGNYNDEYRSSIPGRAYVYDLAGATPFTPVATMDNPRPATAAYFGFSIAIAGTRVIVSDPHDDTGADDSGSAYVYELTSGTPTVPLQKLNHPGPAGDDAFGTSTAVSGTWLVVGAPFARGETTIRGMAWVYDLASATPTVPVVTFTNPSPVAFGAFGSSVAIFGSRVVVGDRLDSTSAQQSGRAFVFDLTSPIPSVPIVTLNNPTPERSDSFGCDIAISGTRVVIGAQGDSTGGYLTGSAYVYDLASPTPDVPAITLINPSPVLDDLFGSSVAISGTHVVVGAYWDDTGASDTGSAYVYDLASATPAVPTVTLNNPSPGQNDWFGSSVSISGTRVVVGALQHDTGPIDSGSAYVYELTSATPYVPVLTLTPPTPAYQDQFGGSVAISGTRIVVGAHSKDIFTTPDAGVAFVYDLTTPTPTTPVATLNNPSPQTGDIFGLSVAIDGTTVAIGSPYDDTVMLNKGAAYVFAPANPDYDSDGLLDIWEYARFGSITAHTSLEDTDGDGRNELLELAFNSDPTVSDPSATPVVTNEGGFLTITIQKRAGVSYLVESAASLDGAAFSTATATTLINNATTLKVRDNFAVGTAPQRMLRVRVTAAP